MAINPNIALQGQPVNVQQALMGGLQQGEAIRNMGVRDALLRQQQQAGQQQLQQRQAQAAAQQGSVANQVFSQLSQVPLAERAGVLARMAPSLSQMGIDPRQIDISDQGIQRGMQATQMFAPPPKDVDPIVLKPGEIAYGPGGEVIAKGGEVPDDSIETIRKEVRGDLKKQTGELRKEASNIRRNYEKLQNLGEEMRKGNRSAVSQGLVALVKLGDPTSVVKEAEMENALNRPSPVAEVAKLLQNKGTARGVIDAVTAKIDPLDPDNVNVDDVMATANAMMTPNIQGVARQFDIVKTRAAENLTPAGIKSVYGAPTEKLFSDLQEIDQRITQSRAQMEQGQQPQQGQQQPGAGAQPQGQTPAAEVVMEHPRFGKVTEADIQQTMTETGMTRQEVFQRLMEQAQ